MTPPPNQNKAAPEGKDSTLSDRVRSLRIQGEQDGKSAPSRLRALPWVVACVLLLTTVAFGYRAYRVGGSVRPDDGRDVAQESKKLQAPGGYSGGAETDSRSAGEVVLQSKGYVIPISLIQVSPQAGGEIIWIDEKFKEGAVYKKGERLAEIDPVIFKAQLDNANAALIVAQMNQQTVEEGSAVTEIETAKKQLETLASRVQMAQIDYSNKRAAGSSVGRDDREKSATQLEIDRRTHDEQKKRIAQLEKRLEEQRRITKAQVRSAEAAVVQARKQLQNCTILAPTSGMVLTKKGELGSYVNPLAFGAAGYLCEMADLHQLEIDLSIQERDVAQIQEGMPCLIMPDAYQSHKPFLKAHPRGYEGVVSRLMPTADRAKGAISVRVRIIGLENEEAGKYLRPEMSALVSFMKK